MRQVSRTEDDVRPNPDAQAMGLALVRWFRHTHRDLPWRHDRADPYRVWVSEIMLQQTQVRTVEPYYRRWMERFPTLKALAAAELDEVLRLWEGLGYYGRARRLHEAARIVAARHDGVLPRDPAILSRLPGIGAYTAGAIAAIAFNEPAVALDANARRVLRRILAADARDAGLKAISRAMMPADAASDYVQALFELGARVCTAAKADCAACPVAQWCRARSTGTQLRYGASSGAQRSERLVRVSAVVDCDDRVLVVRRLPGGVWAGLWEFPWRELGPQEELHACAVRAALEVADVRSHPVGTLGTVSHAVTRYAIKLHAVRCMTESEQGRPVDCAELAWLPWYEVESLPMPAPQRRIYRMALGAVRSATDLSA
ncbi:MAG: A/G-specific adenine glycosylase [Chthonomonadales bacterium]|nr:A/G-specific adenine glycosylase [Chthonomonadales bacterium]